MSSKNLERLKVMEGNDMFPSIDPGEFLLLDRTAKPEIGGVIIFENRFGIKIAHRLLYKVSGYCFTKGDNCACFDFPVAKKDILGVVVGKRTNAKKNGLGELLLDLFLRYYLAYSRFFDIKKKRKSIILAMISRLYPRIPPPGDDARAG